MITALLAAAQMRAIEQVTIASGQDRGLGLLAGGFAGTDALETAAWLYRAFAFSFGPVLIAQDLPLTLQNVLEKLRV